MRVTNHVVTPDVRPVPAQTRILEKLGKLAGDVGQEPIGKVTEDITRAFEAGDSDHESRRCAGGLPVRP